MKKFLAAITLAFLWSCGVQAAISVKAFDEYSQWYVTFDAHPDNKAIQLVTECWQSGKLTFFAVNQREINARTLSVWFPYPRGARNCNHTVNLVRYTGDNPEENYVAERHVIQ